jgi:general secretion pathway protein K
MTLAARVYRYTREMKSCHENHGLALVTVLWIVIVMTAIVAVVSQTGRLNMKMATGAVDEARCKWACRAGVENAIAILNEDEKTSDSLSDKWSDSEADFSSMQMERCAYNVHVTDEAGKLNINTATKDQLMVLPLMESQVADAILDWRDNDEEPQAEGAEAGYYENLRYPYTIRNAPLRTVRELLRVKGVTEQQLYGEDTNLNGQLDYNERDGELSPPMDNGDEVLDQGWIAFLTCYSYDNNVDAQGQARLNVKQASEQQLQSQLGLAGAQARWIVQNRGSFKGLGDLINDNSPKEASNSTSPETNVNPNNNANPNSGANPNNAGNPGNANPGGNSNEPAQPLDIQTYRQIVDKITVTDQTKVPGRINVNTAPEEVLTAIFGGDDAARGIALAIIADRAGRPYGFESIGDLLGVQSVSTAKFKAVADLLTVRSNVYMIRCTAVAAVSKARLQTECVVDRSSNPCTILYWYQGANY